MSETGTERRAGRRPFDPPEHLGEYVFEGEVGRGAMGRVYRYRDTVLDRPVAVKFIAQRRPDERARQQFLTEARAVARLSHPNVIAVYRAGEVDGHPFLVTELVRGRTLAELERPLAAERVVSIGIDLARGLSAAHRRGILHRDVKPANAIIDAAAGGHVKLLDFGLAVIEYGQSNPPSAVMEGAPPKGSGSRLAGTPVYMAPEVLRGAGATTRSDVYSLGAVLYELASGVAPRETLPEDADDATWMDGVPAPLAGPNIDPRLATLLMRCLAIAPEERYPTADALADALAILSKGQDEEAPEGNPYRGLAPFEAAHRGVFFGREEESRAVVDRLRETSFAIVAGDSGVGKSSLCRAGVAPLVVDGALLDGKAYRLLTVLPGQGPCAAFFAALARAFGRDAVADIERQNEPSEIARALSRLVGRGDGALILVDQAEELLTLSEPEEARTFVVSLSAIASCGAARVLVAVRGDYLTALSALPGIGDAMDHGLFLLRPLSREGVRAAVIGPAARHGVAFEPPDLVETLATTVMDTPGGLPLLQFALAEMWEKKGDTRAFTPEIVDRMGGVEGALARHADAVLDGLSAAAKAAARRLLLSLVTSEGNARRRAATDLEVTDSASRTALDALVRGRLVVAREIDGGIDYELSHEALVSKWEALSRWVADSREERRIVLDLEEPARLWERRGNRLEDTLSADEIAGVRARQRRLDVALPARIEAFLSASEERHARARRTRRWQIATGALLAGAVTTASLVVAGELRRQKIEAEAQAQALRLAHGNLGVIDLVLQPFDWRGEQAEPVPVSELPDLAFSLHGVSETDGNHPGAAFPPDLVVSERRPGTATEVVARVEAPGGTAFLRVTGRGRAGETCSPSWIRLRALPGYVSRAGEAPKIFLRVPTCRASAANMVVIQAGPFIYGGAGEPPTKYSDYLEPERVVELPEYAMDRLEVSNAAYLPFAQAEAWTGYPAPKYPPDGPLAHAGDGDWPVTSIDAFTAEAYCRYMGKRLPSDFEWTKAARGGLTLGGQPNPHAKRLYPWGVTFDARCSNLDGSADGALFGEKVTAYPCGASPYGVMNLAGNVWEWISREGQTDQGTPLREVRGGAFNSPPDLEHGTTVFRNAREGRYFDFSISVRCVAGGALKASETWDEY